MKQFYLFTLSLCIGLASCSKDTTGSGGDDDDPNATLEACFEVSKDTLSIGEDLQLTSCSKGASSHSYNLGNGSLKTSENPKFSYEEGGDYTISLTVTNEQQDTKTFSRMVYVKPAEDAYIYPDIPLGFLGIPLEVGIDPGSSNIYAIQLIEDLVGAEGSKFFYHELDESYNITENYIADKPFNSNSAFVNFYPSGNRNFVFTRTLDALYGTQEVTYNGAWGFVNGINSATKHSYGFLPDGVNYLYFGTEEDGGVYKAAIETRNASGDAFQVSLNAFGDADAMIGDMIRVDDGFIAFGGVFTKNASAPHITDYKPLLIFLDASLNVNSHVIFENSELDTKVTSSNDLNGSYHLEQLSNGNLVMYGNGELIVTDATGTELKTIYYQDTDNNQGLISLGDSFVISSDDYLRKFGADGSEQKTLKYNGSILPEFLKISNTLFFMAGYDTNDDIDGTNLATVKIFYGAVDLDLTLVNLNQ